MSGTHAGSSVTMISSSSSMACLCHTGFASTGSVSRKKHPKKTMVERHKESFVDKAPQKQTLRLTYGLITGHSHQAFLLDVGFGGGVTTSSM